MSVGVLDVLALSAFVSGRQPHARTRRLTNLREAVDDQDRATLAAGDGATLAELYERRGGGPQVVVAADEPSGVGLYL
jgi:hypothetical protein